MTSEATELRVRAESFRSLAISYELHCRAMNSPIAQAAYEQVLAAVMEAEEALMSTADLLDVQLQLPLMARAVPIRVAPPDVVTVEEW